MGTFAFVCTSEVVAGEQIAVQSAACPAWGGYSLGGSISGAAVMTQWPEH